MHAHTIKQINRIFLILGLIHSPQFFSTTLLLSLDTFLLVKLAYDKAMIKKLYKWLGRTSEYEWKNCKLANHAYFSASSFESSSLVVVLYFIM